MNTEASAIKALFNESFNYIASEMLIFFLIWYVLCMLTYGTYVPSGLFVPGILMGCGLGHWIEQIIEKNIFQTDTDPAIYAIVTASGILVGYTRLTFSVVVIMLETAQSVDLFMPVMLTVILSVWVGEVFTRSLYVNAVVGKNIPFLTGKIPIECTELRASDIMKRPVQVLSYRETALSMYTTLKETSHNGFPIVD